MSVDINVFNRKLSDDLIAPLVERLNQFEMEVEIHPEFSFENQSGFLPFKFKLNHPQWDWLEDMYLISGFELYSDDFNLADEIENMKPKQSFMGRLFKKEPETLFYAGSEIDEQLKPCKTDTMFSFSSGDAFEFRFAVLASAILADLAKGVWHDPQKDIWRTGGNLADELFASVKAHENALKEDFPFHEFDEWH